MHGIPFHLCILYSTLYNDVSEICTAETLMKPSINLVTILWVDKCLPLLPFALMLLNAYII